jgi:excisionase family DNA binding protein
MNNKLLYSVREAEEVVGLGRSTLFELLRRGEIESVKVGAARRIPRAALEAFVDRLRAESGSESA